MAFSKPLQTVFAVPRPGQQTDLKALAAFSLGSLIGQEGEVHQAGHAEEQQDHQGSSQRQENPSGEKPLKSLWFSKKARMFMIVYECLLVLD